MITSLPNDIAHGLHAIRAARIALGALLAVTCAGPAAAQVGTAFTYQGALKVSNAPYSGTADVRFRIFDDAGGDFQVGSTVNVNGVTIVNGVLTASLDFGPLVFNGDARWLEIAVATPANAGAGPFTTLAPRQRLDAVPYAQFALNVANPSPFVASGANAVFTGGNVGIGTASPTQPLHVTNPLFATLLLDRTGGSQLTASAQASAAHIGTQNNFPFRILTNNTVRMTFDTSGNVGIGTTTPDGKLDIRQSAAADIFNLYDGGSNIFTVIDGGNVGVGTSATAPTQRLQVGGNISLSGWVGTDAIDPFEIFVNNQRAMRFEAASTSPPNPYGPMPNLIGGYAGNDVRPDEVDGTPRVGGAFIGGGGYAAFENRVTDHFGVVAGGAGNMAGLDALSPGNSQFATVGGGFQNRAREYASIVAGGESNRAFEKHAFVGGGANNHADQRWSAVVGGDTNFATEMYAFIGGGQTNQASGLWSSVLGGQSNTASNLGSTAVGGAGNVAAGQYSLAAGRRAKANHSGAFVWGDSTNADFASTAANQFLIRALGGVGVNTNAPAADLHVIGDGIFTGDLTLGSGAGAMTVAPGAVIAPADLAVAVAADFLLDAGSDVNLHADASAIVTGSSINLTSDGATTISTGQSLNIAATTAMLVDANTNITLDAAGTARFEGGTVAVVSNSAASISAVTNMAITAANVSIGGIQTLGIGGSNGGFMLGVNGAAAKPGGGSWSALSDARLKKNIQPLHDSLDRLLALRGVSFEYRDPSMPLCDDQPHDGFIAQEVERVFPQWVSDRADGYKTLSISGFEALTVEALRELRDQKDAEIAQLRRENDALLQRMEMLERMVRTLANRR